MDRLSLPPGFKLHQGMDGLLAGLSIVFLVRVHMAFSAIVDWRLVPEWTYEPVMDALSDLGNGVRSTADALTPSFDVGMGFDTGAAGASGGGSGAAAGTPVDLGMLSEVMKVAGIPVLLTDALSASMIEQLLIVVGFWIAILVPLWCWGLRPLLFWWRTVDLF